MLKKKLWNFRKTVLFKNSKLTDYKNISFFKASDLRNLYINISESSSQLRNHICLRIN